ncbi:acyltransferase [Mesorhizobium sp. SB112]|uniref:acyltransferase family protein n=1 Tax=Mesorhizobium sp. SB112 TaxID=3151853 RepID=UPI003263B912
MANAVTKYNPGLQSIRGIAALVVLLHHASYFYEMSPNTRLAVDTVLNAHAAIILFFVLSGFVLTKSFIRIGSTTGFYIKRAFRILPGLWLATAICAAYILLFKTGSIDNIPEWRSQMIGAPEWTPKTVLLSLFGFPYILKPAYTIVTELFGSLAIPLFFYILTTQKAYGLALILFLAVISYWTYDAPNALRYLFLVHFALGIYAALLLQANPIIKFPRWVTPICLLGLIFSRPVVMTIYTGAPQPLDYEYNFPTSSLLEGLFSAGFILSIVSGNRGSSILRHSVSIWTGNISYGIYLLHIPALFFSDRLVRSIGFEALQFEFLAVLVLTLAITLSAAHIMYHLVEKPFIAIGERLALRIRFLAPKIVAKPT